MVFVKGIGHGPRVHAKAMILWSPFNWYVVIEHIQYTNGLGTSPFEQLPRARGKTEG